MIDALAGWIIILAIVAFVVGGLVVATGLWSDTIGFCVALREPGRRRARSDIFGPTQVVNQSVT